MVGLPATHPAFNRTGENRMRKLMGQKETKNHFPVNCHGLSGLDFRINLMYCRLDLASEKQNQKKPHSPHLHTYLPWLNFSLPFPTPLAPPYHPQQWNEDGGLQTLFPCSSKDSPQPAAPSENIHLLGHWVLCRLPRVYLPQHGHVHGLVEQAPSSAGCRAMPAPSSSTASSPSSDFHACRTASSCFFPHIHLHPCIISSFLKQVFMEAPQTALTAMAGSHSHEATVDPVVSGAGSPIPPPSELGLPQNPALDTQATSLQRES